MAFVQRIIEVTVRLDPTATLTPSKFPNGTDVVTLKDSRTSVRIQHYGASVGSEAQVKVYGLTPSLMNAFSTLGLSFNIVPKNTIAIKAGDAGGVPTLIFTGTVFNGYADYDSAPDVPFHFQARASLFGAVVPTASSSFPQSIDVATVMKGFAKKMELNFENNGVSTQLPKSYFWGNLWTQIQTCAQHANIRAEIVDGGTVLAIWPMGGARTGTNIPLVSKETGMIGYPAYTRQGIIVRTLFNPQIKQGGKFKVQSSIKPINDVGTWVVNDMSLALDSLMPRGQWMQSINAYVPGGYKPIPKAATA